MITAGGSDRIENNSYFWRVSPMPLTNPRRTPAIVERVEDRAANDPLYAGAGCSELGFVQGEEAEVRAAAP